MSQDPISRAARAAQKHMDGARALPVTGPARAVDLERHLDAAYRFDAPMDAAKVIDDVAAMLRRGAVHAAHPAYFGMFDPSVLPSSVAASTLIAAFDPQAASWSHAPAALAMEQHALRFLAARLGYDPRASAAHFTSGGQEANTEAIVVALTHAFPEVRAGGVRALPGDPVIYVSTEGHPSIEKAAHIAGLGRGAVRRVAVDERLRMDAAALAREIDADRAAGRAPFVVVATCGATSSGAIDPLPAIAALCDRERLWLHCDAAWGGAAVLSDRLRPFLKGIEQADSIAWDAHKWLAVPLGAGMLFTRRPDALRAAFATESAYMPGSPPARPDPFTVSHLWSRRASGVSLFATLAELGAGGYARMVDAMSERGDALRDKLRAAGFRVVNDTPLPLVCFTHPAIAAGSITAGELARRVRARGRAFLVATVLASGERVLRACITNHRTEERDLDALIDELLAAMGGELPAPAR